MFLLVRCLDAKLTSSTIKTAVDAAAVSAGSAAVDAHAHGRAYAGADSDADLWTCRHGCGYACTFRSYKSFCGTLLCFLQLHCGSRYFVKLSWRTQGAAARAAVPVKVFYG